MIIWIIKYHNQVIAGGFKTFMDALEYATKHYTRDMFNEIIIDLK